MKRHFVLCLALASLPLWSGPLLLNEVMSKEDQQRTGVAYLNTNQRIALEQWINTNCNCPGRISPVEKEENLYVSINIDGGRKLQLNDNSIWDVDPRDYETSDAWLASIPIKIVPSNDPDYPFLLVNRNTGVSVRVKKGTTPPKMPYRARPQPQQTPRANPETAPAAPAAPGAPAKSLPKSP